MLFQRSELCHNDQSVCANLEQIGHPPQNGGAAQAVTNAPSTNCTHSIPNIQPIQQLFFKATEQIILRINT
jgi:hypothetical protein